MFCSHVCAPHACLVSKEIKRAEISEQASECWEPNPSPPFRIKGALNCPAISPAPSQMPRDTNLGLTLLWAPAQIDLRQWLLICGSRLLWEPNNPFTGVEYQLPCPSGGYLMISFVTVAKSQLQSNNKVILWLQVTTAVLKGAT